MFDPKANKQPKVTAAAKPDKPSRPGAEAVEHCVPPGDRAGTIVKNIKFVVKVNRGGIRVPEYVQRIDRTPIQMTTHLRLALLMGRFTAEDAAKSIHNSRRIPELVPVIST